MGVTFALDYDGTFTADPQLWLEFVKLAQARGHTVHCVTMRHPEEIADEMFNTELKQLVEVHTTARKAKKKHMRMKGVHIHIWIDDNPDFLYEDAK